MTSSDDQMAPATVPPSRFAVLNRCSPLTRIILIYSAIRITAFLAVLGVLWSFDFNEVVKVAVALVASGVLSYPLARKQRIELAERLAERRGRGRTP